MFDGGYRNGDKINTPNKGYGVVIMPEPAYKHPEGHPCHGCVFTFQANKPSCLTGSYPNTDDCPNALYKRIQARQKEGHAKRLAETMN